jgi:hypothetical protein
MFAVIDKVGMDLLESIWSEGHTLVAMVLEGIILMELG